MGRLRHHFPDPVLDLVRDYPSQSHLGHHHHHRDRRYVGIISWSSDELIGAVKPTREY